MSKIDEMTSVQKSIGYSFGLEYLGIHQEDSGREQASWSSKLNNSNSEGIKELGELFDSYYGKREISYIKFSVPSSSNIVKEEIEDEFIREMCKDYDITTYEGLTRLAKEVILNDLMISAISTQEDGDKMIQDEEFLNFIKSGLKLYARVRDEEWTADKGKHKIDELTEKLNTLLDDLSSYKEI